MIYTVYILFSPTYNKIYIGYTSNLIQRFKSHNERADTGWTKSFRPWLVIYCEYFSEKSMAMKREKALKHANNREWIRMKIETQFYMYGFISA